MSFVGAFQMVLSVWGIAMSSIAHRSQSVQINRVQLRCYWKHQKCFIFIVVPRCVFGDLACFQHWPTKLLSMIQDKSGWRPRLLLARLNVRWIKTLVTLVNWTELCWSKLNWNWNWAECADLHAQTLDLGFRFLMYRVECIYIYIRTWIYECWLLFR